MYMYALVVFVPLLVAASPLSSDQKSEEVTVSSLYETGSRYVSALADFYSSTRKETPVRKMKQKCVSLNEGAAEFAAEVGELKTSLGMSSTPGKKRIAAATKMLKSVGSMLTLSRDDLLELTIGEGSMAVDHRRLTLSLDILEKLRVTVIEENLKELKTVVDKEVQRAVLDDITAGLDSVSTILRGLIDTVDDAELNAVLLLGGAAAEKDETESGADEEGKRRRAKRRLNLDLGRGWNIDTSGLNYRRGNFHFNAKPTFNGFRPNGARVGFKWRF